MLYKATFTFFILLLFSAGLLFPLAPTRISTTMIVRDFRETHAIISHRRIAVPIRWSPRAKAAKAPPSPENGKGN